VNNERDNARKELNNSSAEKKIQHEKYKRPRNRVTY
jgi:hypothetical protein